MSTEIESFTLTSGNQLDVGHKDGGLTFDINTKKGWMRFVLPWEQFEKFILACFGATVYNGYRDESLVWFYGDELDEV
jgi:hypothetical protein